MNVQRAPRQRRRAPSRMTSGLVRSASKTALSSPTVGAEEQRTVPPTAAARTATGSACRRGTARPRSRRRARCRRSGRRRRSVSPCLRTRSGVGRPLGGRRSIGTCSSSIEATYSIRGGTGRLRVAGGRSHQPSIELTGSSSRHARGGEALPRTPRGTRAGRADATRRSPRPPARRSSTTKPVTPSSRTSGTEPPRNATTGVPHASASIITRPNGSGQSIGNSSARRRRGTRPSAPRRSRRRTRRAGGRAAARSSPSK